MSAGLMGRGNDVAWHTLNGLQMIQSHHIILADVLTWKTPGHVWSNPEWLFDVLVGATYLKFGWFGVRLLVVLFGELLMFVLVSLNGFAFDVEVLLLARLKGYPVKEMGVSWHHVGQSSVHLKRGLEAFKELIGLRHNYLLDSPKNLNRLIKIKKGVGLGR